MLANCLFDDHYQLSSPNFVKGSEIKLVKRSNLDALKSSVQISCDTRLHI